MRGYSWLATVGLACVILNASWAQGPAKGQPLTLKLAMEDQFGTAHRLEDHRGDVVILVYSDRDGAEASRALGERLHVHFHPSAKGLPPAEASKAPVRPVPGVAQEIDQPDAKMIAVACIADISGSGFKALRSYIKSRFREVAPEVPIWLDMANQMKTQCGLVAKVPNVAVIDVDGQLRYSKAGAWSQGDFDELTRTVDKLRREAIARTGQKN